MLSLNLEILISLHNKMEFANQRGDPNSAWSVGKYAKRSATIHLNSNDLVQNVDQHFTALVTGQDGAGLYFQDPGGAVRDAFATSTYTVRRTGYSLMMQRELAGLGEAWRQRGLH